jgi:hypothetical protein
VGSKQNKPHSVGILEWYPGGTQGNTRQLFEDGEQYLLAVQTFKKDSLETYYQFYVVWANVDPELGASFVQPDGEGWDEYSWFEVDWFAPLKKVDLPSLNFGEIKE